jgi:hypothetical protein
MDLAFYITGPQVQQLVFRLVLRRWRRFGAACGGLAALEIGAQGGIEALGLLIPGVFTRRVAHKAVI